MGYTYPNKLHYSTFVHALARAAIPNGVSRKGTKKIHRTDRSQCDGKKESSNEA